MEAVTAVARETRDPEVRWRGWWNLVEPSPLAMASSPTRGSRIIPWLRRSLAEALEWREQQSDALSANIPHDDLEDASDDFASVGGLADETSSSRAHVARKTHLIRNSTRMPTACG